MKPTRQVSDLVGGLRHIVGLLEVSGVEELPGPVQLYVDFMTSADGSDADQRLTVDRLAVVTGTPAGYDPLARPNAKFANYETVLDPADQAWQVRGHAFVRRPDPAAELAAENERLRQQVAELTAARDAAAAAAGMEHRHVGGATGGPGECEAWCACGVTFAGFDTHAEAAAMLDEHIARPAPDVPAQEAAEPDVLAPPKECGHLQEDDCECFGDDQPSAAAVEAAEAARCCDPGPYCDDLPGCEVVASAESTGVARGVGGAVSEAQPQAAARCSIDPWCTLASPCRACVQAVQAELAVHADLDDGPTLEYSAELVHGPVLS